MIKNYNKKPRMSNLSIILTFLCLFAATNLALGDDINHVYTPKDSITLWVNTVGPYHNPQETYPYYFLPFCKPEHGIDTTKRSAGIGEILEGNVLHNSGLKLHFGVDINKEDVCDVVLNKEDTEHFELAVDQQYWYELFLDDLPMWGMVGETLRDEAHGRMEKHIFTHRSISISYNQNQIIEVNLTSENPVPIELNQKLQFTYSVHWKSTDKLFQNRFNRYLEYDFFEHKIHWFSVFNSFMMVIFLCGLVALILLRVLKSDFAKYENDKSDRERGEVLADIGWKVVSGDVFRRPYYLVLFSALYGTGFQLLFMVLGVILYAMVGPILHGNMYEDRGEMVSTILVCYALSSFVGGYANGAHYSQYHQAVYGKEKGKFEWGKSLLITCAMYPVLAILITFLLNVISFYYESISAIPVTVIIYMLAIWVFISIPISFLGCRMGQSFSGTFNPSCKITSVERIIPGLSGNPPCPWYAHPYFIIPASGILPFGSIFIEMYFIFTSFWSYKFYYVYGFLLLVYVILALVSICTTIVAIYFVLNAENHYWQWIAFGCAASTGFYVYLYSIFYFIYKTQMSGLLQVSFYFSYMFLFSFALSLMCGSLGVWGASIFVKKIYKEVKLD